MNYFKKGEYKQIKNSEGLEFYDMKTSIIPADVAEKIFGQTNEVMDILSDGILGESALVSNVTVNPMNLRRTYVMKMDKNEFIGIAKKYISTEAVGNNEKINEKIEQYANALTDESYVVIQLKTLCIGGETKPSIKVAHATLAQLIDDINSALFTSVLADFCYSKEYAIVDKERALIDVQEFFDTDGEYVMYNSLDEYMED